MLVCSRTQESSMSNRYQAIPKVGTRGRQWLVVNELGGLVREVDGKREAMKAARDLNRGDK